MERRYRRCCPALGALQLILSLYAAKRIPPDAFPGAYATLKKLTALANLSKQPGLYFIPTAIPTAFSVGTPAEADIAVSDGLIRILGLRKMAAVLAHEVSHIRIKDLTVILLADLAARLTHFVGKAGLLLIIFSVPAWLAAYGFSLCLPA